MFEGEQLEVLRSQIMAFKLLSTNSPIPPNLQQALFGNSASFTPVSNPIAAKVIQGASNAYASGPAPRTNVDPNKLIIPTQMPQGIDPLMVLKQRENIINSKIQYRLQELKELPADLPPPLKLKALIEMKGYMVLDKQRKVPY
jgi:ATP-dependent helicase STH1/SNF2